MKHLFSFFFVALLGASLFPACKPQQEPESCNKVENAQNLVESSSIVGLWQQMRSVEVTDESLDATAVLLTPRPRYKCIMADGSYYLLDVKVDADGVPSNTILHYGTYELQGDSIMLEHIVNCSTDPNLAGVTSTVRYSLTDVNTLSIYYNFGLEGGSEDGANEWMPETWKRVGMN